LKSANTGELGKGLPERHQNRPEASTERWQNATG
jgi:hypothetical protein